MILYVRQKPNRWINFVNNVDEMKQFINSFIPGRSVVIGDVSQFNKHMLNMLLKLIEDSPEIDCYSSMDIKDPILLSRFTNVVKAPLQLLNSSQEEFYDSSRDYAAVQSAFSMMSNGKKLRMVKSKDQFIKILTQL